MRDDITAIAFDSAVMTFGVWCENKLAERNPDGSQIHTLNDLLDIEVSLGEQLRRNSEQFALFEAMTRGGTV